jgi:DNA-binding transcriptional MerR regulator
MQSTLYTIGQLAAAAGLPTSTVRYYERRGLIRIPRRVKGDYRYFTRSDLERLQFIVEAHHAGFTLRDIESLLDLADSTPDAQRCRAVRGVLAGRIATVKSQLKVLRRVKRRLEHALRSCATNGEKDLCTEIRLLEAGCGACEKTA